MKLSIAEFKRRMKVGTKWNFTANWNWGGPLERTCEVSQSNSFALTGITDKSQPSWCDWPTKSEATITNEGGKMRVRIDHEFGWLCYTEA